MKSYFLIIAIVFQIVCVAVSNEKDTVEASRERSDAPLNKKTITVSNVQKVARFNFVMDVNSQTQKWIERLGDKKFKTREKAQNKLIKMGESVIPVLQENITHKNNEIQTRVCAILVQLAGNGDEETEKQVIEMLRPVGKHQEIILKKWKREGNIDCEQVGDAFKITV